MDPMQDDWLADEPPPDFADRVMARVAGEEGAPPPRPAVGRARGRTAAIAGGFALAATIALALGWRHAQAPDHGEVAAAERRQVALGARAVAVLEPGARVAWRGDDVEQRGGDVFYRVEPGGAFHVHTPAGDVTVLGTCFRVHLEETEDAVNGRDVKAGVVGAALTAAALVTVYEGKVALGRGNASVTLTAGETARSDATGVHAQGGRGAGAAGAAGEVAAASGSEDALVAANANLADSVREYKNRLETIAAQKTATEKKLADAEKKLATAINDGQVPPAKSEYDLSQDDWKELAKQGRVLARYPCSLKAPPGVSAKTLDSLGLPPGDAQPISQAYQQSTARIWGTIRPLCIQALQGDATIADKLGPSTCQSLINQIASQTEDTSEETRLVAEIRGGLIPMPTDPKVLGTYGGMLYALSGETKTIEQQLAASIGPDDARLLIYSDSSSMCSNAWGVGPRPELPPP